MKKVASCQSLSRHDTVVLPAIINDALSGYRRFVRMTLRLTPSDKGKQKKISGVRRNIRETYFSSPLPPFLLIKALSRSTYHALKSLARFDD